jgi:iduronate 2-sulfatase
MKTNRELLIYAGLSVFAFGCQPEKKVDDVHKNYNVLFISVDDLKPNLNCYGDEFAKTPNFDKLASESMIFSHAYCQQAVCNASRCSMLTGKYPDDIKVWDIAKGYDESDSSIVSLPQLFKENGYFTAWSGKIFHHNRLGEKKWSINNDLLFKYDINDYEKEHYKELLVKVEKASDGLISADSMFTELMKTKNTWGCLWKHVIKYRVNVSVMQVENTDEFDLKDGKITKAFLDILPELQQKDQPFFYGLGFKLPHLPFHAPKRFFDMYPIDKIPFPANFEASESIPEVALHNYTELKEYSDIPDVGPVDSLKALELIQGYYACISYVDYLLGETLKALTESGLRDSTIIVLWSDHGYHLGDHGLWNKHSNFEEATRIPIMISVPGMKNKNVTSDAMIELLDIYPTLAALCNLPLPTGTKGNSLVPLLEKPDMEWKEAAFSQYTRTHRGPEMGQVPTSFSVMGYSARTKNFRYTQWQDFETGEVFERELYDHRNDPGENNNLAGKEEYKKEIEKHAELLSEFNN